MKRMINKIKLEYFNWLYEYQLSKVSKYSKKLKETKINLLLAKVYNNKSLDSSEIRILAEYNFQGFADNRSIPSFSISKDLVKVVTEDNKNIKIIDK